VLLSEPVYDHLDPDPRSLLAQLASAMATAEASCLFFYGTLLHPSVIKRVTGQDVQNLRIQPAVLLVL